MSMKKYKTAVFDLDGTLLNTIDDLTDSVNFMLRLNSFPERTVDEVLTFVGNGIAKLVELSLPQKFSDEEFGRYLSQFREHYSRNSKNKTRTYEGIDEILPYLKGRGVKIAVVSNKVDDQTRPLCKEYFGENVDFSVGQKSGVEKKPAPDGVLDALENLGSSKEEAVYIGDSEVDFATAENSGLDFIGVSWGYRGRKFLENLGAATIIDSPEELKQFFI